jgi:hypothetical protein
MASTKGREPGRHDVHLLDGSVSTSFFADLAESAHADTAAATLLHDGGPLPAEIRADVDMLFEALVNMASGRRASPRYSASAPRRSRRGGRGP